MTNVKHISQIELQCASINKSFQTISYHLTAGDNGTVRLEMEYITGLITQLNDAILNLESIGQQPEEKLTFDNTKNYTLVILQ
jgi:hypothetical protein